jgi:pseudaminic acid cytidylyltransferase
MRLAIIPARGGSKRIPRKNIKKFREKPMIAWAIQTALASNLFDHVVVSTDDEEISDLASKYGAVTPFIRPTNLADDHTPTVPVIAHALQECAKKGWRADYACCIYPCAPFMQVADLVSALELVQLNGVDFVFPVTEYPHPVQRAMRRLPNDRMEFFLPQYELVRTQDLETAYHDAGQFYWGRASAWLAHGKMHTDGLGMPIPNWRVVDIDNADDWHRAELLHQMINLEG